MWLIEWLDDNVGRILSLVVAILIGLGIWQMVSDDDGVSDTLAAYCAYSAEDQQQVDECGLSGLTDQEIADRGTAAAAFAFGPERIGCDSAGPMCQPYLDQWLERLYYLDDPGVTGGAR